MKRILLFASALAGLFLAGSCQKETLEPAAQGGVTYEITLPDGPQTKGENGYDVYDLHYEVYKTATADATELATTPLLFEKTVTMEGNTTTVTLDLLNDQDYTILFWANKQGMDYFDLTDLRNVGVKQAASNNDDRDAFCGKDQLVQHDGAQSKTVELKRPFAQINIATLVNAVDYDINPVSSLVKVSVPVKYNVFTGEPVGELKNVEYTVNTVPTGYLTVNDTDYKKVAMNYALVPATQDNSATVDVYYEINTNNGTVKNTIPNVPVKKNYRTNIIGNLLTSNATYTIEVKPGFEEGDLAPHPLYLAAAIGGEVTLTEDVVLDEPLEVKAKMTINLNGKTITAGIKEEGRHHYAIDNYGVLTLVGTGAINARGVQNFGTMVIDGDITITNLDTNGGSAIWNEGDLVINNGTFTTNPNAGAGSYGGALSTQTGGSAVINGGNFKSYSQLTYAICNYGKTIINDATVTGRHGAVASIPGCETVINAGSFSLLENPGVSDHCVYKVSSIKGGSFTLGNNTDSGAQVFCESTIAEGYKAVQNGSDWFVTEDTAVIVTPETLSSIDFNQSATFMMVGDFSSVPAIGITPTEGVNATVDASRATFGNRFKLNIPANPDNDNVVSRDNGRKGNYTFTNFNGTTLNLGAYGTSVVITNSTLDCIDVYAANISLDINGNTINSGYQMHPRTSGGQTDYAAYLMMMAYDLKFDNNNVSNAIGHAVAINGLKATFAAPVNSANEVKSFTGNTISGISGSTKNNRAGFKIWDDLTYAHSGEKTFAELPAAGQQLITTIENDHTNVFEKAEGTSNTAYMINFYEYYHHEL